VEVNLTPVICGVRGTRRNYDLEFATRYNSNRVKKGTGMWTTSSVADNAGLERGKLLWEEYKYRHDLVWRLNFRVTGAAVLLSVAPYANQDIVKAVGRWIVAAPALAVVLVVVTIPMTLIEISLFRKVRDEYWKLQKELFGIDQRSIQIDLCKERNNNSDREWLRRLLSNLLSNFCRSLEGLLSRWLGFNFVVFYLLFLLVLGAVNLIYVLYFWVPYVAAS
jgi:hypothetical protein